MSRWGRRPPDPSSPIAGAAIIAMALIAFFALLSPSAGPVTARPPEASAPAFERRFDPAGSEEECVGVDVPEGSNLGDVMAGHPPGMTFCLAAGTFRIESTIATEAGDRLVGAGRDATFIDGSGILPKSVGIFVTTDDNYFAHMDVSGAPTPTVESGVFCGTPEAPYESNCGKAFSIGGSSLTLVSVNCHGNGGACIAGGGSTDVTVRDLDCWANGNAYSMSPDFRYASCIKRAAIYTRPGNTTIIDSHIHDNPWVGLWCDFCKYGTFVVENSRIVRNGSNGIQWEMSGGWTADDRAIIRKNVIQDNNRLALSQAGGIGISTSNDITVESNVFGGNEGAGISVLFTAGRNPPQSDTWGVVVRDNTMNGDAVSGCGGVPFLTRLYLERATVALYGGLLVGILAIAVVLHRRLRISTPVALGIGGGGTAAIGYGFVLLMIRSAALCLNNA